MSEIGFLKSKHSAGNNIGLGTLIGFTACTTAGYIAYANDKDAYLATVSVIAGAMIGLVGGALAGSVSLLFKKSTQFDVGGDYRKWQSLKANLSPSNTKHRVYYFD